MRGEPGRVGKRPLRALSANEKMDAIQRVHEGESKASVARDIGVPESTLRGWCKSEHKIRGLARNSAATPDSASSPAASPASTSSTNAMGLGTSNLSSEDEAAGPSTKKIKLDTSGTGYSLNDSSENGEIKYDPTKKSQMDYMNFISSLVGGAGGATGVRSADSNSILLQQFNLLSSVQNSANLTKSLLGLSNSGLSSSHLGSNTQTVGLVENGLQYTKSSGGGTSRKSTHISAIAPTTQFDAVSKARRSLPAAAEAPSTPVPASPRKTNEHMNGIFNIQPAHTRINNNTKKDNGCSSTNSNTASSTSSSRKPDEALWLWLAQQQLAAAGQTAFNPMNNDGSWFWQWYKQCSFPNLAGMTAQQPAQQATTATTSSTTLATTLATTSSSTPTNLSVTTTTHSNNNNNNNSNINNNHTKKSPAKAKTLLDSVLCNNNNDRWNLYYNGTGNGINKLEDLDDENETINRDEAIVHGELFYDWMTKCTNPGVTQVQMMQFKYLLDNIKNSDKPHPTHLKQRRK